MVTLQQDDIVAARPDIDERTAQLVSKGRWAVPGYKVRQQPPSIAFPSKSNQTSNLRTPSLGKIRRSIYAIESIIPFLSFSIPLVLLRASLYSHTIKPYLDRPP